MTDAFISYSRKDQDFVHQLDEALKSQKRQAWVDWEGIRPTEEFMRAIFAAIEGADTFIFILTPDSVSSPVCGREIAHAAEHNKRMIPVVHIDVETSAVPEALAKLNWIFCRESDDFKKAVDTLIQALETDLDWVHSHTRLLTRAIEWETKGKNNSFVLRGVDLRAAEQWLTQAGADKERQPTPLQTDYIIASRKAAAQRQRITLGAVTFGALVAIVLAIVAWSQRNEAIVERRLADERRVQAERESQIALARQLTAQSELLRNQEANLLSRSVLLAVEAMRRFPCVEADLALRAGLSLLPRRIAQLEHEADVRSVAITSDGKYVASGSKDGTALVWEATTGKEITRIKHPAAVGTVQLSGDGKYLATTADATPTKIAVRLWSLPAGKLIAQFPAGEFQQSVAFSPDSKLFAVANSTGIIVCDTVTGKQMTAMPSGAGRTVLAFSVDGKRITNGEHVWDTATGKELSRISSSEVEPRAVDFSPDGKHVATGTADQMALLWDAATGQPVATFRQRRQKSYAGLEDLLRHDFRMAVSFSRDGRYLVTAGGDIQARVWEIESRREIADLLHQSIVGWAAFTVDGKIVITTSDDGTARVWEPLSGHELVRITENFSPDSEVGVNQDGKSLVTTAGKTVSVWSTAGRVTRRFLLNSAATGLTFTRDGKLFAACDSTTARVWETDSGDLRAQMIQKEPNIGSSWRDQLKSVAFSPDGSLLATANGDQTARIWDTASGREILRVQRKGTVQGAFFSPDGKLLVTVTGDIGMGPADTGVHFWEAPDWHLTFHAEGENIRFSPDGHFFAISVKSTLRILETASRREIANIATPNPLSTFIFSPDMKHLATGDDKGAILICELPSGQRVAELKQESGISTLDFSRDGKYLASGAGSSAQIWDLGKGTGLFQFQHEAEVAAVAFSQDGKTLATAAGNTARLWDAATGIEISRVVHDQTVTSVAFAPDSKVLATAGDDGVVQLSLWHPQDLLDEACTRLMRNLTPEEWRQYLRDEPYRETCPNLRQPVPVTGARLADMSPGSDKVSHLDEKEVEKQQNQNADSTNSPPDQANSPVTIPTPERRAGEDVATQIADADAALNRAYTALRNRLGAAEQDALKVEERKWIKWKDGLPANSEGLLKAIQDRTQQLQKRLEQNHSAS
jgi:WD40 repeat protein